MLDILILGVWTKDDALNLVITFGCCSQALCCYHVHMTGLLLSGSQMFFNNTKLLQLVSDHPINLLYVKVTIKNYKKLEYKIIGQELVNIDVNIGKGQFSNMRLT